MSSRDIRPPRSKRLIRTTKVHGVEGHGCGRTVMDLPAAAARSGGHRGGYRCDYNCKGRDSIMGDLGGTGYDGDVLGCLVAGVGCLIGGLQSLASASLTTATVPTTDAGATALSATALSAAAVAAAVATTSLATTSLATPSLPTGCRLRSRQRRSVLYPHYPRSAQCLRA